MHGYAIFFLSFELCRSNRVIKDPPSPTRTVTTIASSVGIVMDFAKSMKNNSVLYFLLGLRRAKFENIALARCID